METPVARGAPKRNTHLELRLQVQHPLHAIRPLPARLLRGLLYGHHLGSGPSAGARRGACGGGRPKGWWWKRGC